MSSKKKCKVCGKKKDSTKCCIVCKVSSSDSLDDLEGMFEKSRIMKIRRKMLQRKMKKRKGWKGVISMTI